jgi:hypothetical protein
LTASVHSHPDHLGAAAFIHPTSLSNFSDNHGI